MHMDNAASMSYAMEDVIMERLEKIDLLNFTQFLVLDLTQKDLADA